MLERREAMGLASHVVRPIVPRPATIHHFRDTRKARGRSASGGKAAKRALLRDSRLVGIIWVVPRRATQAVAQSVPRRPTCRSPQVFHYRRRYMPSWALAWQAPGRIPHAAAVVPTACSWQVEWRGSAAPHAAPWHQAPRAPVCRPPGAICRCPGWRLGARVSR